MSETQIYLSAQEYLDWYELKLKHQRHLAQLLQVLPTAVGMFVPRAVTANYYKSINGKISISIFVYGYLGDTNFLPSQKRLWESQCNCDFELCPQASSYGTDIYIKGTFELQGVLFDVTIQGAPTDRCVIEEVEEYVPEEIVPAHYKTKRKVICPDANRMDELESQED